MARKRDLETVTVKKYANRRLYNTATSTYITLEDLCDMIKHGEDFVVRDAKTNEDLTRQTLTQIIVEQEQKGGANLLPVNFLKQLIRYYDDNLQAVVPHYLESSLSYFTHNRARMAEFAQETFKETFGKMPSVQGLDIGMFERMAKQNMEFFEQAAKMFNPFVPHQTDKDEK